MSRTGSNREYDVIIWGATGYTGKLTAEHVARSFPANIKWAIAGRSVHKLQAVIESCAKINPNRTQPYIEICNLDEAELADLARRTTILIATVGPYAAYGEPAIKACAENGTHYMDVTGELPWVYYMTKKYEKVAKTTGAILISQLGIESTPSDLMAWSLVALIRQMLGVPTREVILTVHDWKSQASGGTAASALSILDHFSLRQLAESSRPFAHSPIPGPTAPKSGSSLLNRAFGVRQVPVLGTLATFVGAASNIPIVERSWGLLGDAKVYGPKFRYSEYLRVDSVLKGVAIHVGLAIAQIFLLLPFVRSIIKTRVIQPGEGAGEEVTKNDFIEYRAVGWPDAEDTTRKAFCQARYDGGLYKMTGIFLAEAALTLLEDDVPAKKIGGGFLTPATLGQPYIDRLAAHGFKIDTRML